MRLSNRKSNVCEISNAAGSIYLISMKFIKVVFVLCLVAIFAVSGASYWLYSSLNSPHQHDKANQFIVVEKGSTPAEIVGKLASEGILASRFATQVYLRTFGDAGNLQAGEYQFESPITPLRASPLLR